MSRQMNAVIPADTIIDDGDMRLYRALPTRARDALGPFVFIDHYRTRTARGIGDRPHPHAGIEVISYLLSGGMEHRDSMGFRDVIGPGDAQWIRAGRGILHAEAPTADRHGLQLWTSLPPGQKFAEPAYASWRAADIPQIEQPGARIVVLAGGVSGKVGPMQLATPTTLAHVQLEPGATAKATVDAEAELGVYVLDGAVSIDGAPSLERGALAMLTPGAAIAFKAGAARADIAILGGAPAARPLLFSGPFVMDTPEHLARAEQDYVSGKMGRLEGVPF